MIYAIYSERKFLLPVNGRMKECYKGTKIFKLNNIYSPGDCLRNFILLVESWIHFFMVKKYLFI